MNIVILDSSEQIVTDHTGKNLIFRDVYKPQAFFDTFIKFMYPHAEKWVEHKEENINEIYLALVRSRRNVLLSECDWTQIPDNGLSEEKKIEWQTYRTALRDITINFDMTKPQLIVWPTKP